MALMRSYYEMQERYRREQRRAEIETRLQMQRATMPPFSYEGGIGLGGGLQALGGGCVPPSVPLKGRLLISDSDTGLQVLQKETDRWLKGVLDT